MKNLCTKHFEHTKFGIYIYIYIYQLATLLALPRSHEKNSDCDKINALLPKIVQNESYSFPRYLETVPRNDTTITTVSIAILC